MRDWTDKSMRSRNQAVDMEDGQRIASHSPFFWDCLPDCDCSAVAPECEGRIGVRRNDKRVSNSLDLPRPLSVGIKPRFERTNSPNQRN